MKSREINNILFALLIPLLVFTGCNDADFLTEKPETFYTVDNAFSTSEQVDQVVISCYAHVRSYHNFN